MFTISTFCIYLFLQTYCLRLVNQSIQTFKHDSWYYNKSSISIARRDTRVFKNKTSNRSNSSWQTNEEKFFWRDKRRSREITNRIFTQTTKFSTIKDDETTIIFYLYIFSRWFEIIMIQFNANFLSREKTSTKYKKTSIKCWRKLTTSMKSLRLVTNFVNSFSRQTLFRTRMTMLRIFWTLRLFVNWSDESIIFSTIF